MMSLWVGELVIVEEVFVARTFWSRFKGLMGRTSLDGKGYLFPHTNSIHTLFMRTPITVVYLSRQGLVLKVTREMKPWRVGPWVRGAWWTLELSTGGITPSVGDRVDGLPESGA